MKRLVHLVAVMLLVGSTAMLVPTNAQAWWGGGWSPISWMNRMMNGGGWGWDDYYYPYYGYPYWGGYPYYGWGYPYYGWGGYPYYGWGGYPYYGGYYGPYPFYGGAYPYYGGGYSAATGCNSCSAPATSTTK